MRLARYLIMRQFSRWAFGLCSSAKFESQFWVIRVIHWAQVNLFDPVHVQVRPVPPGQRPRLPQDLGLHTGRGCAHSLRGKAHEVAVRDGIYSLTQYIAYLYIFFYTFLCYEMMKLLLL